MKLNKIVSIAHKFYTDYKKVHFQGSTVKLQVTRAPKQVMKRSKRWSYRSKHRLLWKKSFYDAAQRKNFMDSLRWSIFHVRVKRYFYHTRKSLPQKPERESEFWINHTLFHIVASHFFMIKKQSAYFLKPFHLLFYILCKIYYVANWYLIRNKIHPIRNSINMKIYYREIILWEYLFFPYFFSNTEKKNKFCFACAVHTSRYNPFDDFSILQMALVHILREQSMHHTEGTARLSYPALWTVIEKMMCINLNEEIWDLFEDSKIKKQSVWDMVLCENTSLCLGYPLMYLCHKHNFTKLCIQMIYNFFFYY
jgi:hypothetical protein